MDSVGSVWLTDVGLHQVAKFKLESGARSTSMRLERRWGIAFEPGKDTEHFCQPTAVAVTADGGFFVADGYCNNRILRFNSDGSFLQQWGERTEGMRRLFDRWARQGWNTSVTFQMLQHQWAVCYCRMTSLFTRV